MGKLIKLEGRILVPTEPKLRVSFNKNSLSHIFWNCYNNQIKEIPIFPVREDPYDKNKLLVLDGNHRSAIYELFDITEEIYVFLAESALDKMEGLYLKKKTSGGFEDYLEKFDSLNKIPECSKYDLNHQTNLFNCTNYCILSRWGKVISRRNKKACPRTFEELRNHHSQLKDIETAKKYLESVKF